jgi:hypothetical protein
MPRTRHEAAILPALLSGVPAAALRHMPRGYVLSNLRVDLLAGCVGGVAALPRPAAARTLHRDRRRRPRADLHAGWAGSPVRAAPRHDGLHGGIAVVIANQIEGTSYGYGISVEASANATTRILDNLVVGQTGRCCE